MERDPAAAAIERFRRATACSPELRDENWRAVQARVDAVSAAPAVDRRMWWIAALAVAAAAAALWWGARAWSSASAVALAPSPQQAIDAPDTAASGGLAVTPAIVPQLPAAPRAALPDAVVPRGPLPARAAANPPVSQPDPLPSATPIVEADRLAAEARAIRRARAAIDTGAYDDATAALDLHAREFPEGTMIPERMTLRVRIACARHDRAAAQAAAAAYVRAHPDDALARRLATRPCDGGENP